GPRAYGESIVFANVAGAVAGTAQSVVVSANQTVVLVSTNFSAYGQDAWKLLPKLTLTYGLRWDVNSPFHAEGSQHAIGLVNIHDPATIALAPSGTPLYETTYHNFAPRLGVAYQLNTRSGRETVLRGGFGVFYDLGSGPLGVLAVTFPFTSSKTL